MLVYHHSIYSPADHAKDADNKVRRVDFPTTFSEPRRRPGAAGPRPQLLAQLRDQERRRRPTRTSSPAQADVFPGPGGVIYVTANSASGSKYYDITAPDSSGTSGAGNGADPLNPSNYWYNSVQNQEHVRTYVKVQVRDDKLVVENVRSGTCAAPNAAVELGKVAGAAPNTAPARPAGRLDRRLGHHPPVPRRRPGHPGRRARPRLPASSAGRSTATTAWSTSAPPSSTTATTSRRPARSTRSPCRTPAARWRRGRSRPSVGDFRDGDKTFSGTYLGWTPKVVPRRRRRRRGCPVASGFDDGGKGLSVSRGLGSAAQGHPKGTAKLGADLDLKIPGGVAKGSYRATLTITALGS